MPYFGAEPSSELANLDINGQKFILDADADTSITADTDDTIDIEIAGQMILLLKLIHLKFRLVVILI